MLTIWGRSNSINVQKVIWCADELKLKYERIDAGMEHGVVNTPQYRALNPNGLVPTIEDGGVVVWESNVILRYLCAKYGAGSLWPEEPAARAQSDKWMDWQISSVWPKLRPVFWGLIRTAPDKRDPAAIEESRKASADLFGILDSVLADREFVAGKHFTMGDIPLGVMAQRWFNLPIERPKHPHLEAWYQRLMKRDGFKNHVDKPLT